jgi:hypothetical protein
VDVRGWITRKIIDYLTEPLPHYQRFVWNDPQALLRHIRKGDVLLVDGDNRVSQIIKYLTQSCWSHAALFVGDELLRRGGVSADRAREAFGEDAEELLVEALPHGVIASPLSKYVDYNIRIARPHRLQPDHLKLILEDALAAIGWRYDLRNVFDLARYLVPVHLVPNTLRRTALHFGSGQPTEVICSSLLGRLFAKVRFPILPQVEYPDAFDAADPARPNLLRRIFGFDSEGFTGIFRMRHPTLLTPRDFDLSPYFEIVKFNVVADGRFDYQRIQWAEQEEEGEFARPYGAARPEPTRSPVS